MITGLPSHPQHELAKRQCTGCPGMITFYIKGTLQHAQTFLKNLKVNFQKRFLNRRGKLTAVHDLSFPSSSDSCLCTCRSHPQTSVSWNALGWKMTLVQWQTSEYVPDRAINLREMERPDALVFRFIENWTPFPNEILCETWKQCAAGALHKGCSEVQPRNDFPNPVPSRLHLPAVKEERPLFESHAGRRLSGPLGERPL